MAASPRNGAAGHGGGGPEVLLAQRRRGDAGGSLSRRRRYRGRGVLLPESLLHEQRPLLLADGAELLPRRVYGSELVEERVSEVLRQGGDHRRSPRPALRCRVMRRQEIRMSKLRQLRKLHLWRSRGPDAAQRVSGIRPRRPRDDDGDRDRGSSRTKHRGRRNVFSDRGRIQCQQRDLDGRGGGDRGGHRHPAGAGDRGADRHVVAREEEDEGGAVEPGGFFRNGAVVAMGQVRADGICAG
ncbi:hypothetical protein CCUS01_02257 [Colletotrichum cuscutae]|uniref:Uncharacterized protein n=1 Tax=Colletotrichum cuscutae TaxID=1209917 RepID=A0AAI9U7A8_9PEZI|nr:hypothetical protein CCUS01_02257 [Colletotrichum cuscutae]